MAKYRNKPKIVEATQWFEGKDVQGVEYNDHHGMFCVTTIHNQRAFLQEGDWVITEPDGIHHYPCKPDIFEAIYEPVL